MTEQKKEPKPGKVIRIPKDLKDHLADHRQVGESWGGVIRRLLKHKPQLLTMWTLPSKLLPTKGEARGIAIAEAVNEGRDLSEAEQPIKVCEVK